MLTLLMKDFLLFELFGSYRGISEIRRLGVGGIRGRGFVELGDCEIERFLDCWIVGLRDKGIGESGDGGIGE